MSLESRSITTSVRERDTDLLFVQLVETSSKFRKWLYQQFLNGEDVGSYLSVSHSVETGNGESDIEIGFEKENGERTLLLIENKIDATLQERQAERYHDRGERYVGQNVCDKFEVGIIAPSEYLDSIDQNKFEAMISYESILDQLETMSHDSVPFVTELFNQAITKQTTSDDGFAGVTQKIKERYEERSQDFPDLRIYDQSENLIKFRSNDPDHPNSVRYMVWVIGTSEGREAMVRISIDNDIPESQINDLQAFISDRFETLSGFEIRDHVTMDTVRTYVSTGRDEPPTNDEYIDDIVGNLHDLVSFSHPLFVEY